MLNLQRVVMVTALAMAVSITAYAQLPSPEELQGDKLPPNAIWLDSLVLDGIVQDWGYPKAGTSVDGNPLTLNGVVYKRGVGTHANSEFTILLKGSATDFISMVGIDDEKNPDAGSVRFLIVVDGKTVSETELMRGYDESRLMTADLRGAKELRLLVSAGPDGNNHDHADWAGAMILLDPSSREKPAALVPEDAPKPPIKSGVSDKPSINGPRRVGATPGYDFLFMIPATGKAPLKYSAKNLPEGLTLDPDTGIITGAIRNEGEHVVDVTVKNKLGTDRRKLTLVAGKHKLALTPPLGWNSWNCWGTSVDDAKVRAAADAMVASGLASHGFTYINIDDAWEGKERDANGNITTNEKFPDMKALADYVHSKGLKLGIYSSPGPYTCARYLGSYQHEEQDAKTWAEWGIDYVKYDWCSYQDFKKDDSLEELKKPYFVMRDALDKCGRDIVYSLCQYGMGNVWEWGAEVGGNCWRTTGDITDSWKSMMNIGFHQWKIAEYAGPGHWNDPDMLVVGKVGWGPSLHETKLTPHEQVTHITIWVLVASPLLIGCDMTKMEQFTIDLLSNDEVLDVNQDPLGKAATRVWIEGDYEVWSRPLFDGTLAVGLFNRSLKAADVTAKWSDLGIEGRKLVRDLWQQKDIGSFKDEFTINVGPHGAQLVKIGRPTVKD